MGLALAWSSGLGTELGTEHGARALELGACLRLGLGACLRLGLGLGIENGDCLGLGLDLERWHGA